MGCSRRYGKFRRKLLIISVSHRGSNAAECCAIWVSTKLERVTVTSNERSGQAVPWDARTTGGFALADLVTSHLLGQEHHEAGPVSRPCSASHTNPAAVLCNNTLADPQAHTGSFGSFSRVEGVKQIR